MTYLNYKKKIELKHNDILQISNYAKKNKIDLFASCFDVNSLKDKNKKILKDNAITSIIVSHDIDDASAMSDRVLIIKNGIIVQNGSPKEVVSINSNISLKNS